MGIELVPRNPQMEVEHFNYPCWNEVYAVLRDNCRHIFTNEELWLAYWNNGFEVEEWKAVEISRTLVAMNLVTKKGDTPLDVFCDFCRDSKGFFIK